MNGETFQDADEEMQRFWAEIERRRSMQIIGLGIVVILAVLAVLARISGGEFLGLPFVFWGVLAAIFLVAKIIFLFIFWRCPRCSSQLGPSYNPRFCSGCGLEIKSSS